MNIIIPAAGLGSRFKDSEYRKPKPFIDVNNKMMIQTAIDGVKLPGSKIIVILQENMIKAFPAEIDLLKKDGVSIISIEGETQGASCTVLSAKDLIDNDEPILICDCDNFIENEVFSNFIKSTEEIQSDGSLITFDSDENCFSYVKTDKEGVAVDIKEKIVISNNAIAGFYYFRRGSDFVNNTIDMMIYNEKQKDEFYISGVLQRMISKNKIVNIYNIAHEALNCVGTPSLLTKYLENHHE